MDKSKQVKDLKKWFMSFRKIAKPLPENWKEKLNKEAKEEIEKIF